MHICMYIFLMFTYVCVYIYMYTLTQLFAYVENYLRKSAEYTYNIYIYTHGTRKTCLTL